MSKYNVYVVSLPFYYSKKSNKKFDPCSWIGVEWAILQKNNFCYSSEKADARDKPAAKIRENQWVIKTVYIMHATVTKKINSENRPLGVKG